MTRLAALAVIVAAVPLFGQKQVWKRALGEGYSGIAAAGGHLYTMYRVASDEIVAALDASTGKTLWEYKYAAALNPKLAMENGPGPHCTPLVLGDRVYTIGILARMHAFQRSTGKLLWSKDLYRDFPGSTFMGRGYSSSPVAYKNTIVVKLGGPNHALVALKPEDGSLIWAKHDFQNSPSSPAIMTLAGREQIVASFAGEIAGFDPATGAMLWSHAHPTRWGLNISTPTAAPNDVVLITSAYDGGTRAIQVSKAGAKELWHTNRMRVHIGNTLHAAGVLYGSSGDFGPAPMTAIDVSTGKILWQDRAFAKANLAALGSRTVVLDEDGALAIVSLTPKGLEIHSKAQALSSNTWTAPTLEGKRVYVRDRRHIAAYDLE